MKELKDTVDMMNSDDYKERFVAEYEQLDIRITKLRNMVIKYEAGKLDFTPNCPLDLLKRQLNAMIQYKYALEVRAQIEEIDLSDKGELA